MDQAKIGQLIKSLRKEHNLSQRDLADKLGVSHQAVSKWENGKNIPDIAILKQISEEFNLDLNDILNGENNKQKTKKTKTFIIVITLLLLTTFIVFLNINNNSDDYDFKIVSANCDNFKVSGSVAYNDEKSTIHLSKIEYCGKVDLNEYQKIELNLYESMDGVKKEIGGITSKKSDTKITLENFLANNNIYIEDYHYDCQNFQKAKIYLEIKATQENKQIITYQIPLTLDETCHVG